LKEKNPKAEKKLKRHLNMDKKKMSKYKNLQVLLRQKSSKRYFIISKETKELSYTSLTRMNKDTRVSKGIL